MPRKIVMDCDPGHDDAIALLLAQGSPEAMEEMLEELLGTDWDDELEPFRYAGDGAAVRWLHKVG